MQIEDFNICSSDADYDLFFSDKFRTALEMAIKYQLDNYKKEQLKNRTYKELDPSKLTLYFYPNTAGYWFEIKDSLKNPTICLMDSVRDWMQKLEETS